MLKILTWLGGLGEEIKRNHVKVAGQIIYFLCFVLLSLVAKLEF